ncbi:MAG: hypothetical protein JNL98_20945 [Bryobacterales bacterium]|nr:hypothetical protein [Bryobacterales bacterium]
MGTLLVKTAKDQFQAYLTDPKRLAGTLLAAPEKTSPEAGHTGLTFAVREFCTG